MHLLNCDYIELNLNAVATLNDADPFRSGILQNQKNQAHKPEINDNFFNRFSAFYKKYRNAGSINVASKMESASQVNKAGEFHFTSLKKTDFIMIKSKTLKYDSSRIWYV